MFVFTVEFVFAVVFVFAVQHSRGGEQVYEPLRRAGAAPLPMSDLYLQGKEEGIQANRHPPSHHHPLNVFYV